MSLVLGITGGIASGKSTFTQLFLRAFPSQVFNADAVARELLNTDLGVQEAIRNHFPESVVDGEIHREQLRQIVFADESKRRTLEGILHPPIREAWMRLAELARASGSRLIVDIPLLFETGTEKYFDATVVVGCSQSTQIHRLKENRNIGVAMAQSIIAAQWEIQRKIAKADFVIWNESSIEHLESQGRMLAGYLTRRHG